MPAALLVGSRRVLRLLTISPVKVLAIFSLNTNQIVDQAEMMITSTSCEDLTSLPARTVASDIHLDRPL